MLAALGRYHRDSRSAPLATLAVLPLWGLYAVGVSLGRTDAIAGVDPTSGPLLAHLSTPAFLAIHGGLILAVAGWALWRLRSAGVRRAWLVLPVGAESAGYGLGLSTLIFLVMEEAHLLSAAATPAAERAVIAAGAGLWEELVFRAALLPLLAIGFVRVLAMPRVMALLAAVVVSSLLFAGAHHLAGEPFDAYAFTYRTLAGALFAGIMLARGFGVAAWTHATYDFYVLSL